MTDTTYATLADLRTYSGIPASTDDALLQSLLNAAAALIDGWCNTTFVSTTVTLEMHSGAGSRFLKLKHRPVLSVTTVQLDGTAMSTDAYEIDYAEGTLIVADDYDDDDYHNPRIHRRQNWDPTGWPVGTQNIGVTYAYGYSAIPDGVGVATCMTASALYTAQQRRGAQSESLGPRSITYGASQSIPDAARALLDRYREFEIGG